MLISQSVGLAGLTVFLIARGVGPPSIGHLWQAAAAGAGGLVGLTAFYRGLAIGTMSIVAPIAATGVIVPVIVGVAEGNRPAALQVVGIAAAIVGVVLASREHGPGAVAEPVPARTGRTSIALALVAALGFGSFMVGLRTSAAADVPWALFSSRAAGVVLIVVVVAVRGLGSDTGLGAAARPVYARVATLGLIDLSANALYAVATRHGLLSIVSVASSLYPLVTVLLARVLLGEQVRRLQEVGIVTALAGVVLIAAG
jgi:drug/metabolite transporter (DMT)-like permease